jgi:hypothetical protein
VIKEERTHRKNCIILIYALLLLNFFAWLEVVETTYSIPKIIKYIISITVLGTIIYYRIANPSKPKPGTFYYFIIWFFILWSLKLLISACFKFNSIFYIQRVFGQTPFFIPYIIPILILFSKFDLEFIRCFFHYSYIFILPAIAISLYIIASGISTEDYYEQSCRIGLFDLGSSFLLLTSQFSKKKHIFNIAVLYYLLMIFLALQWGRRGMLVEYLILLLVMFTIRFKSHFSSFNDRLKIYFVGLTIIILLLSFSNLVTSSYAFQRGFSKAGFIESRGMIFEDFFSDFSSAPDWIFGRGLEGTVLRTINPDSGTGDIIENGFLDVILKGGLIYLVPFILILLRASYLGLFKSNNDLAKASASLILIYLIMMSYFNLPVYSTKYISLWIYISICFTPSMRNYSNEEIYQAINLPFKSSISEIKLSEK